MIGLRALATSLAVGASACATPSAGDAPKEVAAYALAPYAMHEECAQLAAGDRFDYTFNASAPVAFNIHYHDGAAVVEPITRRGVTEDASVFVAAIAQNYCLTWEADAAPATLDYRVRVRRADR